MLSRSYSAANLASGGPCPADRARSWVRTFCTSSRRPWRAAARRSGHAAPCRFAPGAATPAAREVQRARRSPGRSHHERPGPVRQCHATRINTSCNSSTTSNASGDPRRRPGRRAVPGPRRLVSCLRRAGPPAAAPGGVPPAARAARPGTSAGREARGWAPSLPVAHRRQPCRTSGAPASARTIRSVRDGAPPAQHDRAEPAQREASPGGVGMLRTTVRSRAPSWDRGASGEQNLRQAASDRRSDRQQPTRRPGHTRSTADPDHGHS
jgi:hypothetical protein